MSLGVMISLSFRKPCMTLKRTKKGWPKGWNWKPPLAQRILCGCLPCARHRATWNKQDRRKNLLPRSLLSVREMSKHSILQQMDARNKQMLWCLSEGKVRVYVCVASLIMTAWILRKRQRASSFHWEKSQTSKVHPCHHKEEYNWG